MGECVSEREREGETNRDEMSVRRSLLNRTSIHTSNIAHDTLWLEPIFPERSRPINEKEMAYHVGSRIQITTTDGEYVGILQSLDDNQGRLTLNAGKI